MQVFDISWPLSAKTTEYKDKKTLSFDAIKTFDADGVRDSVISMGSHTGTHVDAPAHFVHNGALIEKTSLAQLIGPARVYDLTHINIAITADDLKDLGLRQGEIVLFKTKNSGIDPEGPFEKNFIYLDASGAQYCIDAKVKAVGIDYLGIERNDPDHTTHTKLMHADIPIIEGLRLGAIKPDSYFCMCLPLKIIGLEAAPARAVLIAD